MSMKLKTLLFLALISLSAVTNATVREVACSGDITAALQSAINSSVTGATNAASDTVSIGAGTCSITGVSWTDKNITLMGAGKTNTIINCQSCLTVISNQSDSSRSKWRVTGMTWQGTAPGGTMFTIWDNNGSTAHSGWRIDNMKFNFPGVGTGYGIFVGGPTLGLIDHNDWFWGSGMAIIQIAAGASENGVPPNIQGALNASFPLALGSDQFLFIEDNTFTSVVSGGCAVYDTSSGGGRVVYRHNTATGCMFYDHWTRAGEIGGIAFEIYNNTFTGVSGVYDLYPVRLESGTGVIHDNTFTGFINDFVLLSERRGFMEADGNLGACDGTKSWDGNAGDPAAPGWPCLGQIGRSPGITIANIMAGTKQTSAPLYIWQNGTQAGCATGGTCTNSTTASVFDNGNPVGQNYVKATAHAINGEVDYVLNGSTAKPGYAPFQYPHPQNSGTSSGGGGGGGGSFATPAVVQSATNSTGAGIHTTSTSAITTTTGNTFVVVVQSWGSPTDLLVSDSKGNSYTQIGPTQDAYWAGGKFAIYYAPAATGGSGHTFTVSSTLGEYTSIYALEISGIASNPLDQTTGWNRDFTTPYDTAITGTTTQASEIAIAFFATAINPGPTPVTCDTGWTLSAHLDNSAYPTGGICYKNLTTTGTVSTLSTVGPDNQVTDALLFTLKAAAVASPPTITSSTSLTCTAGSSCSYTIAATNSPTSYSASPLPTGLSVNTSTGAITGTPSVAGTTSTTIGATNAGGTGTATLTITVNAAPSLPPVINSSLSLNCSISIACSYTVTATNSPTSYGATGLPAGLSINTSTGDITGTPTTAGTSSVTITATNAMGSDSKTLTVTVSALTAATYYVRADGTAQKASATGPVSSKAGAMSMATFNASTFIPGDVIYISANGGRYTTPLCNTSGSCSGAARSSGDSSALIRIVGLPDSKKRRPVIYGLTSATPQLFVGNNAEYLEISGIDTYGGTSVSSVSSVKVGTGVGDAGAGYTVALNDVRVLANNKHTGANNCFEIDSAGSSSKVRFSGVSAMGCIAQSGQNVGSPNAAFAINGNSAQITNSSASLVNRCIEVSGAGSVTASKLTCNQIVGSGILSTSGTTSNVTCSDCVFSWNSTYTPTCAGTTLFGAGSGSLVSASTTLSRSRISIKNHCANASAITGALNIFDSNFAINSPKFNLSVAGAASSVQIANSTIRLTSAVPSTTARVFSVASGGTMTMTGNSIIADPTRSVSNANLITVSSGGSLTSTNNLFSGCQNFKNAPNASGMLEGAGTKTQSGDSCN